MEFIDIGCNLTHDSFDADRDAVVSAAFEAGVTQIVVTGASEEGTREAHVLAQSWPGRLFTTAGVHPHHARDVTDKTLQSLREHAQHDGVVAVGETGLDYFRDISPRDVQRRVFEQQLEIGIDCGLPLFLHQRDAHADFIAIVRQVRHRLRRVVVHCFTGSREELRECLDLDCHIGITGWICDERRGTHMTDYLSDIPADRLMIESDAPYLKPRNLRPRVKTHRNEPRWLPWVAGTLAAWRGETVEELAFHTTATARAFFGLPLPPQTGHDS